MSATTTTMTLAGEEDKRCHDEDGGSPYNGDGDSGREGRGEVRRSKE